jgi:excinuclease ABC subunit C
VKNKNIKKIISKLPDSPGVYFFRRGKEILYIGKATMLKDRVRSYMSRGTLDTRGPLIEKMLGQFDDIKYIKTDSVLEALILEANLIKKHQPYANTMEKDDRSFNYVVITDENFPRVLIIRGHELEFQRGGLEENFLRPPLRKFGPFTNNGQLKEAIKIVRKMFPFRDKCIPLQNKPCFNRQIDLCPGVCTGEISKKEYAKQIKNIVLFFEGKKKLLVKKLEKEMRNLAKKREFEKAQKIKRQIFALYHIQDIALIKNQVSKMPFDTKTFRIESYDIAHLSGTNVVGVMIVVENGEVKKTDYRKFKIRENPGINDTKALSEILTRRLAHAEWSKPDLIVVDGGLAQKRIMEKVLKENNTKIPVVSVVKDERHKPKEILSSKFDLSREALAKWERQILLANAEAHRFALSFHKQLRRVKMTP